MRKVYVLKYRSLQTILRCHSGRLLFLIGGLQPSFDLVSYRVDKELGKIFVGPVLPSFNVHFYPKKRLLLQKATMSIRPKIFMKSIAYRPYPSILLSHMMAFIS